MEERRQYYRIDDRIYLQFRQVDANEADWGIARLRASAMQNKGIFDSLLGMETRLTALLESIGRDLPDVANAIKVINNKVDLAAQTLATRALSGEDDFSGGPNQDVSIGGGGCAFSCDKSLQVGVLLELEMVLFPAMRHVRAYGKVVDCRAESSERGNFYSVGTEFTYLSEEDRDFIVSHVLTSQSKQLRNARI